MKWTSNGLILIWEQNVLSEPSGENCSYCLIETAWPGFPSALIVSRYAVSAQWLTAPLPVCLYVWHKKASPHLCARSDCSLHPRPMSLCLSVCLSGRNLTSLCWYVSPSEEKVPLLLFYFSRNWPFKGDVFLCSRCRMTAVFKVMTIKIVI